ncbi:hypothetical protein [Mesorhizobium sp.]|uniref:hypothetical protein n=1 Tax=Mesorhizobium sp. TaxID=1871066 RepID=UPI000FE9F574|nr:hypothetical protein [Mesorhizobium sp.]RWG08274.1 MAG: hypothetical protein EOQ54_00920 [Mesorhizobium sp.]
MPTEFLMPFAEDGHAEGDPPTQAEIVFDRDIDLLIFDFWKATLPEIDITFQLPLALEALRKFKPVFQLDPERRDKLINAIGGAAAALIQKLPHIYHPRMVGICMTAAATIVRDWAEDEQQKAAHHPHRLVDAELHVRILERDLHNACDFAWLQQRKAGRQQEVVWSLLTRANDIATEQVAA